MLFQSTQPAITTDALITLSKNYFETYPDNVDMLVIWGLDGYLPLHSFYQPITNDTPGLGDAHYNNAPLFGSKALQGIIWMGEGWQTREDKGTPESVLGLLAHELAHRFGASLQFDDGEKSASDALIAPPFHWSFFLDTGESPLRGNRWIPLGDGRFRAMPAEKTRYCPLDLYLMGLLTAEEIEPLMLLTTPLTLQSEPLSAFTKTSKRVQEAITIQAKPKHIGIEQILAAVGERKPTLGFNAKRIRMRWLVLTSAPLPSQTLLSRLKKLQSRWPQFFKEATNTLGTIEMTK